MEDLHAKVWVFLVCHSCHQNTEKLQEGTSSQIGRSMPQHRMHLRRRGLTEFDTLYCDVLAAL